MQDAFIDMIVPLNRHVAVSPYCLLDHAVFRGYGLLTSTLPTVFSPQLDPIVSDSVPIFLSHSQVWPTWFHSELEACPPKSKQSAFVFAKFEENPIKRFRDIRFTSTARMDV